MNECGETRDGLTNASVSLLDVLCKLRVWGDCAIYPILAASESAALHSVFGLVPYKSSLSMHALHYRRHHTQTVLILNDLSHDYHAHALGDHLLMSTSWHPAAVGDDCYDYRSRFGSVFVRTFSMERIERGHRRCSRDRRSMDRSERRRRCPSVPDGSDSGESRPLSMNFAEATTRAMEQRDDLVLKESVEAAVVLMARTIRYMQM